MLISKFKPGLGLVVLLGLSGMASAQTQTGGPAPDVIPAEQAGSPRIFAPSYFTEFVPRSALDMIRRVPGFDLVGAENKRGLGQGGANVLINGARIAGKTGARDTLSRINAGNVVRIEILDGASIGIPGLSGDVANVITKTSSLSGLWEWEPQYRSKVGTSWLNGEVSISGERGNLGYSLKLENDSGRRSFRGTETLLAADESVFEIRDEATFDHFDAPGVSLDLSWSPFTDHAGNLNLELNTVNRNDLETSERRAVSARGEELYTELLDGEDEWNASAGGDYQFPFLAGTLKLIGYTRFERSPTSFRFNEFSSGQRISGTRFDRLTKEGERIARAEYSWLPAPEHDWQIAAEGAFNFLDTQTLFYNREADDSYTPDPDSAADTRVEEKRAEISLTNSRPLSPKWDLQTSLGAEYSELSQTGSNNGGQVREFFRPKGYINATYSPRENLSIRMKMERIVGQLNFFDFVESVTLDDDLDSAANPDLVPDQRWTGTAEMDMSFRGDNNIKLTVFGEQVSDVVGRIPIGPLTDAVGNIGSSSGFGLLIETTLKDNILGVEGTELNLFGDIRTSNVTDPITGRSRALSHDRRYFVDADFRHDIPNTDWAYGFSASYGHNTKNYRLTSVQKRAGNKPSLDIFAEHKDVYGLKIKLELINAANSHSIGRRTFFDQRRDIGSIDYIELRDISSGRRVKLEVSGTF